MNRKLTLVFSLLFLVAFSSVGPSLAQTQGVGVHVGDKFVYSLTSQWSSSNQSVLVPRNLMEINGTTFFNVTVTAIQNPSLTENVSWSFKNGTSFASVAVLDVDSGNLTYYVPNAPVFEGFFYANQSAGDILRPTGNVLFINQTISVNYPGSGVRDTNLISFTFNVLDASNTVTGTQTTTYYIDRDTGALVRRTDQASSLDPITSFLQTATVTWTLTETNLWAISVSQNPTPSVSPSGSIPSPSIPEFPSFTVVPILLAATLVGVLAFKLKQFKGKQNI